MEVRLGSLAVGQVGLRGLLPLHVAVALDGVALLILRFLLLHESILLWTILKCSISYGSIKCLLSVD